MKLCHHHFLLLEERGNRLLPSLIMCIAYLFTMSMNVSGMPTKYESKASALEELSVRTNEQRFKMNTSHENLSQN